MLQTYAAIRRVGVAAGCAQTALTVFLAASICPTAVLAQRPLGVDVSYWQGSSGMSQANWNAVAAAGRSFAFIRCTHYSIPGVETDHHGDPDPTCGVNVSRARAAGLTVGVYHYARPSIRSPQTEADAFVQYATQYFGTNFLGPGYLRPVLDLEEHGGQVPVGANNLANWANAWMDAVEQQTGVEPMIYCNTNYAVNYLNGGSPSLAARTLWLANWTCPSDPQTANPPGSNPDGIWSAWTFWQYCSTTGIPGVSLSRIDQNLFNGTAAQMQNYVIGPAPPLIILDPTSLTRSVVLGNNLTSDTFTVANDTSIPRTTLNYSISESTSWITGIAPASGASSGAANTHTVNYSTSSLSVGQYAGTITVTAAGALNSPQQIGVSLKVWIPGDVDLDQDVDLTDFGVIQACLTPTNVPASQACLPADCDEDGDVDAVDVTRWINCANGPGNPPSPGCS